MDIPNRQDIVNILVIFPVIKFKYVYNRKVKLITTDEEKQESMVS